jgi:hypothetical protein
MAGDAQVSVEGETKAGKTMSVFDALEDLDADTILAKVDRIRKEPPFATEWNSNL